MHTSIFQKILSNGYMPLLPVFLWNILFIAKLPAAYQPNTFNADIPLSISVGENVFRVFIFFLPLLFHLNINTDSGTKGLKIYGLGLGLYFASWLMLMHAPNHAWSQSFVGFIAPAYTPIIWLIGLALMVDNYYFKWAYAKWHYILPALVFSAFHIAHSIYVYQRIYG